MIKIISHAVVASYLLIRYPVPNGTGNYYLLFYSHFGVPTARQHGCLQYHIPIGMFHLLSLFIFCHTNQKNPLIPYRPPSHPAIKFPPLSPVPVRITWIAQIILEQVAN